MSYHSAPWWRYCLLFVFACQLLLGSVLGLEFHGNYPAFAPAGNRSDDQMENATCSIRGVHLDIDHFKKKAAVDCYMYTNGLRPEFQGKVCYNVRFPKICLNCKLTPTNESQCYLPDINDETSPLFLAFRTKAIGRLWANCVRQAIACCRYMRQAPQVLTGVFCNRTWDGLACYDDTAASTNVSKVCPSLLYIYSQPHCEHYSTRWCHKNGTWYKQLNQERTFYSSCAPKPWDYVSVYHYSIGLLALSVLSLIPALVVFNWYKSLQVPRISIHKHLCFSVMMCGTFYIIDHAVFTLDDAKPTRFTKNLTNLNVWWCKLLTALNRYFMVSQYSWMLCEGCYLHRLVAQAFSQQMNLKVYYGVGWGAPVVLVIIYSVLRATKSDVRCWRNLTVYDYVFTGPILAALAVNIFFMTHVVYILVTKLRQSNVSDTANFRHCRKVLRAVLILIPIFGCHFILTTFVSPASCSAYLSKQYAEWTIVGLQGLFVSLIFCYFNGEVQGLVRRSYVRYSNDRSLSRRHRPSVPLTTTTTTTTATTAM
ncbi:calcitonin gene-related peptide type 1 receptor isoform X1 [Ixodes scapularis]|uniref:calcitonin gene-related peptide type 1 receptor isoform X1 n=1 Tax=Ixodes scapularis TaxID=6945 RepID=UPI001C391351|nr:calcitonin gene-related peptide type 1 receptor isoform X1 [Ixodes scapularis]XP_040074274.2 calcitonin gene-related peptide type 1 receptor isoform X1 [Ixodes scapularis]